MTRTLLASVLAGIAVIGSAGLLAATDRGPDTSMGGATPPSWRHEASRTGSLSDRRSESWSFTLLRDRTYRFDGACDQDCSDLDFELYDENGNLVDSDLLLDDFPVVTVTPSRSGRFRLRVTMASCDVSPCGYDVDLYRER
jgi:hypothetical protein